MTFLELCQDLMREAGISGSMASVDNQTGEALRVVNWIIKAYRAIQLEHEDWDFMRADVTFDTSAPNDTYTAAAAGVTGFGEWRFTGDDWRCYLASAGVMDEQPLEYVDYDRFKRVYEYSAQRLATGRPTVITQRPDHSLQLWPTPDDTYTIVGEQYRAPLTLAKATDTPIFAAKFHDVIVQRALMMYGIYEGDATVHAGAQSECMRVLKKMESIYLPDWQNGGPMA